MNFDIQLRFQPSEAFLGILAERNARFSNSTDSPCDRAGQTADFLHASAPLPGFDESLFQTPLNWRAVNDLLQVSIALLAGNYPLVRDYRIRCGYPQLDPEAFMVHDNALQDRRWIERGAAAIRAVNEICSNLGLRFPKTVAALKRSGKQEEPSRG